MDVKLVNTTLKTVTYFGGSLFTSRLLNFTRNCKIFIADSRCFEINSMRSFFFYFYVALFLGGLGFQLNISQLSIFLLKVTHVHSTAGLEQDIPRLQLACDLSRFLFQQSLSNSRLLLTFRHGPKSSRSHSGSLGIR